MAYKILVADDDPGILELIMEYLVDQPEELLYAPNGQKAIEIARDTIPDLIIMDWEMPVLNGIEAVKALQADPTTRNIPIIISTGVMKEPKDLKQALESGAVDYMRKPLHPIEFNARVRANLRIKMQHEQITSLLQREKALMKESIARKDRELTAAALNENKRNELIQDVLEKLGDLMGKYNMEDRAAIISLRNHFKNQLNFDKNQQGFLRHFEEVHPGFFDVLEEKFPNITVNDRRICAYLRIGLNNKEIAQLLNVESASVRKSLTRLKKKMMLGLEDDLREVIAQMVF